MVEIPGLGIPGFKTSFDLKGEKRQRHFAELRLEGGIRSGSRKWAPHKNLGILMEIAPQMGRLIVFAGVPENRRLYWEIKYRGISAKWISHVEEKHLPALIRGAFCVAQPSLVEGYGYPPLEAMACGRPAIVSRIPVLLETTGNCALSASPDGPDRVERSPENPRGRFFL